MILYFYNVHIMKKMLCENKKMLCENEKMLCQNKKMLCQNKKMLFSLYQLNIHAFMKLIKFIFLFHLKLPKYIISKNYDYINFQDYNYKHLLFFEQTNHSDIL